MKHCIKEQKKEGEINRGIRNSNLNSNLMEAL